MTDRKTTHFRHWKLFLKEKIYKKISKTQKSVFIIIFIDLNYNEKIFRNGLIHNNVSNAGNKTVEHETQLFLDIPYLKLHYGSYDEVSFSSNDNTNNSEICSSYFAKGYSAKISSFTSIQVM